MKWISGLRGPFAGISTSAPGAQLISLRDNLNDAVAQLKQTNPNDSGAIGRAFGAASNLVGVFGTRATDPQLRAAIHQMPECQHVAAANPTNQPSSRRADRAVEHDMSVVDDLSRLAELRDRGDVSAAEYDQAKQQVLGAPRPATGAPDGGYLL